jgi:competence protein ComEC
MVRLKNPEALPACGDLVEIRGMLSRPAPPRNPGEFDAARWLWLQGIAAEVRGGNVRIIKRDAGLHLKALALRSRDWIAAAITADIADQPAAASAIKAMVLGTREDVPEEIDAAFLHSGTLHVFSVSGLHVSLVAVLIWRLLNLLRLTKRQAALASIPLIFFYALLTGWQAAAVRSAVMASVILAGVCLNRPTRLLDGLIVAGLVVLAADTQQLFMAGAQLSFVVLATIAVGAGPVHRQLVPFCRPDPFLPATLWSRRQRWITAGRLWLATSLAVSLAAALGSTALTLWHFQLVTPVSLLANLVQVPLALLILATASGSALVALVWSGLSTVLNNANLIFARWCLASAAWFAQWPGGYLLWNPRDPGGGCRVTVFDVDAGGSVLIRTPDGHAWLIDTGRPMAFRSVVRPGLNFHAVKQLNGLVLTHGDNEHVGGTLDALSLFHPNLVLHAEGEHRSPAFRAALAAARARARPVRAGETVPLGRDTTLEILFPPAGWTSSQADDACLVMRLEHAGRRALVVGDSGFLAESWLLEHHADLKCDILIKGRHRNDLSGTDDFLTAAGPRAAVCTAADFPSSEQLPATWVTSTEARGITVFDQSQSGAVEIRLGPEGVEARGFVDRKTWQQ